VHMVRNGVDHGIEPDVSDRIAAGKPATANLRLSAYQKGGNICIDLEDDGRGLNREAILRKARERGLLQGDGSGLEDREVWAFIFEPGFSTAAQVTEVSGRGVGMDVVKRTFEELRGRIEIQSTLGKGTRFTIWLPLTMAIIDGMVVRAGGERCIFPTLSVTTVLPYREDDSTTVLGKGRLLNFQGRQVPIYALSSFFSGSAHASEQASQAGAKPREEGRPRLCVLAENEGRTVGFVVDDLIGKQQIVIKSLGDAFKDIHGLAGGAILTDGGVGLILDIDGLVKALSGPEPSAWPHSLNSALSSAHRQAAA
jgi:two-component system, chemotaxis family, sensor kinase CheA